MKRARILAAAATSGVVSAACAQSAAVRVDTIDLYSFLPGDVISVNIYLDYEGLPAEALGLAGWNIAVDVNGGTVTGASYLTPTSPLIDQNNPFGGDPTPEVSGNTVNFSEGLNAFSPASAFHTGGALAQITIDTTGLSDDLVVTSRLGDSPLGAFTYALPGSPPFSYVGVDFDEAWYGNSLPGPGSLAVLTVGAALGVRRQRTKAPRFGSKRCTKKWS